MPATSSFRDFGILPQDLQPPPATVRSFLSTGRIIGQYIATALVFAVAAGILLLVVWLMPSPVKWVASAAVVFAFASLIYAGTRRDYAWVELTGDTIRAKHLYTGHILERNIEEIESLSTLVIHSSHIESAVIQSILGRVKGIEIHFRNESTLLRVMRADPKMTNAQELIEAILYRMKEKRELDADVIDFEGQPLARSVVWKGERPFIQTGPNVTKVIVGCFMFGALMAAIITGFIWMQEGEVRKVGSLPAHEITLADLIKNGPGENRHVIVTDFEPGGIAYEEKDGSWTFVSVAVFPTGQQPQEIEAVMSSKQISNEGQLRMAMQPQRFEGICSAQKSTSWGVTLGPNLVQANNGLPLKAAWDIDELRYVPSEEMVKGLYIAAMCCSAATILMSLIVIWKT